MRNIMVGYDGSNASKEALSIGIKHAKAFGARLYIVRSLFGGTGEAPEKIETANRDMEYAESVCRRHEVDCATHVLVRGMHPGEDLVKFAEENQVGEIVVGIRRRSKVGKMLFGSNARYVIMEAPCPVVTVR